MGKRSRARRQRRWIRGVGALVRGLAGLAVVSPLVLLAEDVVWKRDMLGMPKAGDQVGPCPW